MRLSSGGQKKLVLLAKLLVQQPQLLFLDEPDNHLDIPAKENLEEIIKNYPGSVVNISHDRYLLDDVATDIAELERGALMHYAGNYSAYTTEKELRRLRQQQLYAAQQKEITESSPNRGQKSPKSYAEITIDGLLPLNFRLQFGQFLSRIQS